MSFRALRFDSVCRACRRAAYAARVGKALDLKHCRVAHTMEEDGLYLHKRPVRGAGSAANILSQAGSIFHHIVLFVKTPQVCAVPVASDCAAALPGVASAPSEVHPPSCRYCRKLYRKLLVGVLVSLTAARISSPLQGLTALEMGPRGDADVASNIFEAVEAGPIVCHAAEPPADGAPLLHIAAPHHTLTDPAVQKASCKPCTSRPFHIHRSELGQVAFTETEREAW